MIQGFDIRSIKYRCVKAYLNQQLLSAEEIEANLTETIVEDAKDMKAKMRTISDRFVESGSSYEHIERAAASCPYHYNYYNQIGKIVNKHFKAGDEYIPAFLTLETLSIYKQQGYKDFEDFDILALQAEFEKFNKDDREHRALINKHYKCADELVKYMNSYKIYSDRNSKKPRAVTASRKKRKR